MSTDDAFRWHPALLRAVELMHAELPDAEDLPDLLPATGIGDTEALERMSPHVLGKASALDDPLALAHMDPPTPWITWAMAMWNARLNQNLLHPGTSAFASRAETCVIDWLKPFFGMSGGQFCAGSSLANLTALWAARDAGGVDSVVASDAAHLSVQKSAKILGLPFRSIPVDAGEQVNAARLGDLSSACLVLTAGTTVTGSVDNLDLIGQARWSHVDAAWAGALRFTEHHAQLLDGIDNADSVALSAHKWLFQPKDSALVLFRDNEAARAATGVSGSYLANANVGVQGSRGAAAVPLMATLLAWGQSGLSARIEATMAMAEKLANAVDSDPRLELWSRPITGITVFRPLQSTAETLLRKLPVGMFSSGSVGGDSWLRSVAANPLADLDAIVEVLHNSLAETK